MQGEEERNWQWDQGIDHLFIFHRPPFSEESKIQLENDRPHLQVFEENQKCKKQGRPKGDKNNQGKMKRSKDDIPEEKKQRGHWSLEQNKRYHWFLEIYHMHFIKKEMRRLDKIFKTMALFVGSRQAQQCRSHHQKMEKKFHSFCKILLHLRKQHYGNEDLETILKDIKGVSLEQVSVILTFDQLKEIEVERQSKQQNQESKKCKEKESQEKQKHVEIDNNFIENIFGDNYQYQFDMNNLLI